MPYEDTYEREQRKRAARRSHDPSRPRGVARSTADPDYRDRLIFRDQTGNQLLGRVRLRNLRLGG